MLNASNYRVDFLRIKDMILLYNKDNENGFN